MDPIITALIGSTTAPVVLVLLLVVVALFGMLREQAKAAREEGAQNRKALEALVEVITQLRIELARRHPRGDT